MSTFQQKIKKVFDNLSNFSQIFTKLPKLSEQKKEENLAQFFNELQKFLQFYKQRAILSFCFSRSCKKRFKCCNKLLKVSENKKKMGTVN